MITTRNDLPKLINKLNLKEGVEIGVWKGEFSEYLLEKCPQLSMLLVDCWSSQPEEEYFDIMNQPPEIQEQCYKETQRRMKKFGERAMIIRDFSAKTGLNLRGGSYTCDFIYFDANHTYEAVKADLEAWYPLIKVGGLVSGHDYLDGDNICGSKFGVKSAVDEFIADKNISDFFVTNEAWPTWGFIKGA